MLRTYLISIFERKNRKRISCVWRTKREKTMWKTFWRRSI